MNWGRLLQRHPSAFLLTAQLLSLCLYPFLDGRPTSRIVFGACAALLLLLTVWVVNRSPAINRVVWVLAAGAFAASLATALGGGAAMLMLSSSLEAALYFYAAGALIAYMMHDQRVTTDELFAAGATFTVLSWGFAYAFVACQAWNPASFTGLIEPERTRTWLELLSLSFTTLSAVGSGDVLPIGAGARVLVMLEQFAGVGYLAIVVGRLIGLTIVRYR
ncbi:MAG TPA: potassium channel family protein [Solimonas sp.]